jgi:hypothetical protein
VAKRERESVRRGESSASAAGASLPLLITRLIDSNEVLVIPKDVRGMREREPIQETSYTSQ